MNLDPAPKSLDGVREMKVKIPLKLHVSLHSLKLLSGRQISDIVTEALLAYMAQHTQHGRGPEDLVRLELAPAGPRGPRLPP